MSEVIARRVGNRISDEPAANQARLARVRTLSKLLDSAIQIPGTKITIGLDPIVGLIPGVGDLIPFLISLYIVYQCKLMGVSKKTVNLMLLNVLLDLIVGEIPILGDLFDFAFKANIRNLKLLEKELAILGNSSQRPVS